MKYIIMCLLVTSSWSLAQTESASEENISLTSASEVASHLRQNHSLSQAVYLTQVTVQLSQSFGTAEQLALQWQQATESVVAEPLNFTQINSHALMAQSLIRHTNGMTLNRWRQINIPRQPEPFNNQQTISNADSFLIWLNLTHHWQDLLNRHQQNLQKWHPWFKTEEPWSLPSDQGTADTTAALDTALNLLQRLPEMSTTALAAALTDEVRFDPLSAALLRQKLHQHRQQPLAFAYDWIEAYQLLELSSGLLTAEQQQQLGQVIEQAMSYWAERQDEVDLINESLFALTQQLLSELPEKFKNPDHQNPTINDQIFTLITGISNASAYFEHPLRQDIQENLEVCLNLSVQQQPEPPVPIADQQFLGCLNEMVQWAQVASKSADLAGNVIKLDSANSINRATDSAAVQIINNLTAQAAGSFECQQQLEIRSNWLEWAMAAETLAWFNDRWPGLMVTQDLSALLDPVINHGQAIFDFPECVVQNQPLQAQFEVLLTKWERLKQEIISHVNGYISQNLAPNSDVDMFKSIDQVTQYVPENFIITACDPTQSCGAFVNLEPSPALLRLFPNHLSLAAQFGLGELAICYEQVRWENRQTAPTHLDNNKIANFEGQLALRLTGKFRDQQVFSKDLVSQQSHLYLFGENTQEVLDTACPLPLVGTQINTSLDRGTFGLLPNRLTFLTASKVDINGVLKSNWESWLEQISETSAELSYFDEMLAVKAELNDAFLNQVTTLQQEIYRKLITNNPSRSNDSALSRAAFDFISHRKLFEKMVVGLYPQLTASDPQLQAAINGSNRLVDMAFFRQNFQSQTDVVDMLKQADENFAQHQGEWLTTAQPGSVIHNSLNQLSQLLSPNVLEQQDPTTGEAEVAE